MVLKKSGNAENSRNFLIKNKFPKEAQFDNKYLLSRWM